MGTCNFLEHVNKKQHMTKVNAYKQLLEGLKRYREVSDRYSFSRGVCTMPICAVASYIDNDALKMFGEIVSEQLGYYYDTHMGRTRYLLSSRVREVVIREGIKYIESKLKHSKQGGLTMDNAKWYWAVIRWETSDGKPMQTEDQMLAPGADVAYHELHDRVNKKPICGKIKGGSAHLMNQEGDSYEQ